MTLNWQPASDPETGIREYRIYRDGKQIGRARGLSYQDAPLPEAQAVNYTVTAVNGRGMESAPSSPLALTTPSDMTPPGLMESQASSTSHPTEIRLRFDEPLDPVTALEANHYEMTSSASISGVILDSSGRIVTLKTSPLPLNKVTFLYATGIRDRAATPNTMPKGVSPVRYDPALVAEWRVGPDGTTLEDESGRGNRSETKITSGPGREGRVALRYEGVQGSQTPITIHPSLDLNQPLSLSLWLRKLPGASGAQTAFALTGPNAQKPPLTLFLDEAGRVRLRLIAANNKEAKIIGRRIDALDWHHIAVVSKEGAVELYVDGVRQARGVPPGTMPDSVGSVVLGGSSIVKDSLKGFLDDIRLYQRPMEVLEIVNAVLGRPVPRAEAGDVNEDGFVDKSDAVEALRYALGLAVSALYQGVLGDTDGGGGIDLLDVRNILRKITQE